MQRVACFIACIIAFMIHLTRFSSCYMLWSNYNVDKLCWIKNSQWESAFQTWWCIFWIFGFYIKDGRMLINIKIELCLLTLTTVENSTAHQVSACHIELNVHFYHFKCVDTASIRTTRLIITKHRDVLGFAGVSHSAAWKIGLTSFKAVNSPITPTLPRCRYWKWVKYVKCTTFLQGKHDYESLICCNFNCMWENNISTCTITNNVVKPCIQYSM